MEVISFGEWVENQDLDIEDCLGCFGMGEIECDHCGQTTECEDCEGYGTLYGGMSEGALRREYRDKMKADKEKFLKLGKRTK
jgi:hypothetical protein